MSTEKNAPKELQNCAEKKKRKCVMKPQKTDCKRNARKPKKIITPFRTQRNPINPDWALVQMGRWKDAETKGHYGTK